MSFNPPITKKGLLLLFLVSFFVYFLPSPTYAVTGTNCGVVAGTCQTATCNPSVWEGYVRYYENSNCTGAYADQLEWFSNSSCATSTGNPCPASCTTDADCGEGICTFGNLTVTEVCAGTGTGTGNKWCIGAVCGYNCNTTGYTCDYVLAGAGTGQYTGDDAKAVCTNACVAPPTPTPTPLPAPTLSGPPESNCSADGQTLSYSWNSITGAVRYAIRINDWANGWDDINPLTGDTIDNNVAATSYSRSSTPGATYDAWVHAVDDRGVYSDPPSNHVLITCSAASVTATPSPTPGGPTPTPTPVPCIRCGTGGLGFCSGSLPIAFPEACQSQATCADIWQYAGDAASNRCAANYPESFPYCWVCSILPPTPTPDPLTTPTPTIAVPACLNYSTITSASTRNLCGPGSAPEDDTDPNTVPISFTQVPYSANISCCAPHILGSVYCNQVSTDPDYGTWQGRCRIPALGPAPATSTLTGTVFVDERANGIKQGGEPGWPNVRIYLSGGGFSSQQNTVSDSSGNYQFTGLINGTYRLEIEAPFGFSPTASFRQATFSIPPAPIRTDLPLVPYQVAGGVYTTTDSSCPPSPSSKTPVRGHSPIDLSETYFSINYPSDTVDMGTDPDGLYNFSPAYSPASVLAPSDRYSITTSTPTSSVFSCIVVTNTSETETVLRNPLPYEFFELSPTDYKKTIDFYYLIAVPWFRGVGGDMRIDSGFNDLLPPVNPSESNRYALNSGSGGTPGVIFSGNNLYDFCLEDGDCKDTRSSEERWVVGGQPSTGYPETFTPAIHGTTRTSYSYLSGVVKQAGITPTPLPDDCYDSSGCALSDLDPGIYKNKAGTTDVYIKSSTFQKKGSSSSQESYYVFLIDGENDIKGNLHILGNINVTPPPNAATLTVSVSGNISIDKDVGGGAGANTPIHVEGFYSVDGSFIVESEAGTNAIDSNCNTTPQNPDKRLNMAGSVVVNAGYGGGTFDNRRSLCGNTNGNVNYPTFQIEERPDFILNAPDILKHPSFVWQEVAP